MFTEKEKFRLALSV